METSVYQLFKIYLMKYLPLSKDAIHIYIGLFIYFTSGLLFKRLASWRPVLIVFMLSIIMECIDLRDDQNAFGHFRWGASFHDLVNTMFWPVAVSFILRIKAVRNAE